MSKAFTREDDSSEPNFAPPRAPLPPGTQNYITPEGAAKIKTELERLLDQKRNSTTPNPSIDTRIQYLQSLTQTLVIVEPTGMGRTGASPVAPGTPPGVSDDPTPTEVVRFGSTVSVIQNDSPETYRIVGVDEIDLACDHISWLSPLARALMGRRTGDQITFRAPAGPQQITILRID